MSPNLKLLIIRSRPLSFALMLAASSMAIVPAAPLHAQPTRGGTGTASGRSATDGSPRFILDLVETRKRYIETVQGGAEANPQPGKVRRNLSPRAGGRKPGGIPSKTQSDDEEIEESDEPAASRAVTRALWSPAPKKQSPSATPASDDEETARSMSDGEDSAAVPGPTASPTPRSTAAEDSISSASPSPTPVASATPTPSPTPTRLKPSEALAPLFKPGEVGDSVGLPPLPQRPGSASKSGTSKPADSSKSKKQVDSPARIVAATTPLDPDAEAPFQEGMDLFAAGDYASAANRFQTALEKAPDHPVILVNLGTALYRLNRVEEALDALGTAVSLDIDSGTAWLTLGIVRFETGDIAGAHAALAQASYLEPENSKASNYLGVVMTRWGVFDAAEKFFAAAIEAEPGYAEAHFNLAVTCLRREPPAPELAKRHYFRARELGAAADAAVAASLGIEEKEE